MPRASKSASCSGMVRTTSDIPDMAPILYMRLICKQVAFAILLPEILNRLQNLNFGTSSDLQTLQSSAMAAQLPDPARRLPKTNPIKLYF